MIYIIDFGSQTTHLIKRRLRDLGFTTQTLTPDEAELEIDKNLPQGLILSGGPSSVYAKNAPMISKKIFEYNLPILGICYGFQLTAKLLGGNVSPGKKEYGPATIYTNGHKSKINYSLKKQFRVWMSHGDEITKLPSGFKIVASTNNAPFAFVAHTDRKIFGLQFHPEVEHSEHGTLILKNFAKICDMEKITSEINIKNIIKSIKETVKDGYVVGAVSGGVDSTVASILCAKAIGKKFIPIFVDNGLMRIGTTNHVKKIFNYLHIKPMIIRCEKEMLSRLKDIDDPEEKRKIIGNFYIKIFEQEVKKRLKNKKIKIDFLLQGTIYSDIIESKGTKYSSKIKSHHNVGGLPKKMNLKLIEPLKDFYKDEVRKIGTMLKLPKEFIYQQPFPGPGYAIRIKGKITKKRLMLEKIADLIVIEELKKANIFDKVFLSFPILTDTYSTAVKGDERFIGEVVALRIIDSKDVMTSKWSRIPYVVLGNISSRIVNEVPGISRVVYDITTKAPATMEWE